MRPERSPTALLGLGTAVPPHSASQGTVSRFMERVFAATVDSARRERLLELVRKVYSAGGIERRHSVVSDYGADDPADFRFYPPNWRLEPFPTTRERMRLYEKASVDLAEEAASRALDDAGLFPGDVTHLVIATCTGFFAPGPDVALLDRLGLRPGVERTIIGFMGCYAGFNGMRAAGHILRAHPESVVLQVCVELCSLHYQKRPHPDVVVANSLFADGCAAAVWGARDRGAPGHAEMVGTASFVDAESRDQMTWSITDHGFEMRLSADVPRTLGAGARRFVGHLLDRSGVAFEDVHGWAVHPGGTKILAALEEALELDAGSLEDSAGVLRDFGNMSSGTILFVLERLLRRNPPAGPLVALGFGPGLTLEGAVLRRETGSLP